MVIPGRKGMSKRRMNAKRMAMMLSILSSEGSTINDLVDRVGLSKDAVSEYVNELRNVRPKILRVDEWQEGKRNGHLVPVYVFGSGPDQRRPPKKTNAERARDYRLRRKARRLQSILGGINV